MKTKQKLTTEDKKNLCLNNIVDYSSTHNEIKVCLLSGDGVRNDCPNLGYREMFVPNIPFNKMNRKSGEYYFKTKFYKCKRE